MESEILYTAATDSELDELLAGREAGTATTLSHWSVPPRFTPGSTGVLWNRGRRERDAIRPLALISDEDGIRRLCGRYAQLRSDLSPLTAWCHLFTPAFFERLDSFRQGDLRATEAAWTGLIVAEALLLADRPLASIRISACLATQSFAIARTKALWPDVSLQEIAHRFEAANRLCRTETWRRSGEARAGRVRLSLQPLWASLEALLSEDAGYTNTEVRPIVNSLRALQQARADDDPDESRRFIMPVLNLAPEAQSFEQLAQLTPEMRLRLFDKLIDTMASCGERERPRRSALALAAGYLATVAAGGAPSLTLVESNASRWPEITAWAYLVGGIGERVIWTSSFDGLGRLVARELVRPLKIDEPPTCDFGFEEAAAVADPKLSDPLVNLRLKQARVATIALFPGVNVAMPMDGTAQETSRPEASTASRGVTPIVPSSGKVLAVLAEALWPYMRERFRDLAGGMENVNDPSPDTQRTQGQRSKRRSVSQTNLPLKDSRS